MNILYFDQNELWSPQIEDLEDEYNIGVEDEEYISISRSRQKKGRWLSLYVSALANPALSLPIQIADE